MVLRPVRKILSSLDDVQNGPFGKLMQAFSYNYCTYDSYIVLSHLDVGKSCLECIEYCSMVLSFSGPSDASTSPSLPRCNSCLECIEYCSMVVSLLF